MPGDGAEALESEPTFCCAGRANASHVRLLDWMKLGDELRDTTNLRGTWGFSCCISGKRRSDNLACRASARMTKPRKNSIGAF